MRTVALCEIEAFAIANLVAKMEAGLMDPAPIWTDLKTFPWEEFRDKVDVLSGGYPCQPFSAAGKRLGTDDPRHLWPYIASGIRLLRPKLCFFENVEGHISLGLREVVGELEELGYETTWGIFSAAECGAPHQRKRVFIMAHDQSQTSRRLHKRTKTKKPEFRFNSEATIRIWPSRPGQPQHAWEPPRVVANSQSKRAGSGQQLRGEECRQGRALPCESNDAGESMGNSESGDGQWSTQGEAGHAAQPDKGMGNARGNGWRQDQQGRESKGRVAADRTGETGCQRQIEPALGGDTHGPSDRLDYAELCVSCDNRTDELRLLGNGVVPATAELAFRTLLDEVQPSVHH